MGDAMSDAELKTKIEGLESAYAERQSKGESGAAQEIHYQITTHRTLLAQHTGNPSHAVVGAKIELPAPVQAAGGQ